MRRFLPLIASSLSATAALVLTACGGATEESASPVTTEKTVIDVWLADFPFPGYLDRFRKAAADFNSAHSEYQVNIEGRDYATIPADMAEAAEQGDPPAIANYYYNATRMALDAVDAEGEPLFVPVEQAIGGRSKILGEQVILGDLADVVRDTYTFDGRVAALPLTATTPLLFGNQRVLDAAGVSEFPRTWAELQKACAAIAAMPDRPKHCVSWANHSWFFQQALAAQGAPLVDHDNGRSARAERVDLDSPRMLAFVQWWRQLAKDGHFLYTGGPEEWMGPLEAFTTQQVAFIFNSANQTGMLTGAGAQGGFGVQVGRLPYAESSTFAGNPITGDALWLVDGLDEAERDGALAFMMYLLSAENVAARHRDAGYLPVTGTAVDLLDKEGWFNEKPKNRVANEQLTASDRSPAALGGVFGGFQAIETALLAAMDDVLDLGADPAERFARAEVEAQQALDEYNANCVGPATRESKCFAVGENG